MADGIEAEAEAVDGAAVAVDGAAVVPGSPERKIKQHPFVRSPSFQKWLSPLRNKKKKEKAEKQTKGAENRKQWPDEFKSKVLQDWLM